MTDQDHLDLIAALRQLQGMLVLSGYATGLYTNALPGWSVHSTTSRIAANKGAGGHQVYKGR